MNRTRWLMLIAGVLVLLLGGRMVLRYLDWQASEAARQEDRIGAVHREALVAIDTEIKRIQRGERIAAGTSSGGCAG
jgi:putative Mn2+ efflux pump MntP